MKNLKKIIIAIFIIIIILVISLIFLLKNNKRLEIDEFDEQVENSTLYNYEKTLQIVTSRNDFYTVQTCVEKFYVAYSTAFSAETNNYMLEGEAEEFAKQEQENNINMVFNMLDEEYISFKEITKENIKNKFSKINTMVVTIENMYVSQQNTNTFAYLVYGNLRDTKTNNNEQFSAIVKIDMLNKTFKILLGDYVNQKYKNVEVGREIQINVPEKISNDGSNIFDYRIVTEEQHTINLLDYYKKNLIYNRQRAYEQLDEQYKQSRFKTQQNFEQYIQNNIYNISVCTLSKYQTKKIEKGTQYVCIDQKGNYYIFQETAPMQYTVMLDTYTIDLPEFIQKYSNSSDEQKVLLNIQKIFEAINSQDYEYVYNKLDQTFKANNFSTLQDFENYANKNFFAQNKVVAGKAEKQSDVYIYNLNITDASGNNKNAINKNFVMKLKEGTDFVMSFSIN